VLDGDAELRQIEQELQEAEAAHDGTRQAELHVHFDAIDGYSARARAGKLMSGLGFAPDQLERPVAEFSGGWRVRLNLARALMCRSDLLLLDEPTNHLDLDAVLWLEQWLRAYPGTLLLISHDRDVLDNVADRIAHIDQRRITLYPGNYSRVRGTARRPLGPATGGLRETAAGNRPSGKLHHPLPRQGDQGAAGAKPDQGVGADGAHRRCPCGFAVRVSALPNRERLPNPLLAVEKSPPVTASGGCWTG
jgi:energy-coupling factor transporter ATP-binding protein EcfA2